MSLRSQCYVKLSERPARGNSEKRTLVVIFLCMPGSLCRSMRRRKTRIPGVDSVLNLQHTMAMLTSLKRLSGHKLAQNGNLLTLWRSPRSRGGFRIERGVDQLIPDSMACSQLLVPSNVRHGTEATRRATHAAAGVTICRATLIGAAWRGQPTPFRVEGFVAWGFYSRLPRS
jgi:hypothetical protein